MDLVLDTATYGENVAGDLSISKMLDLLGKLEAQLQKKGYEWHDVSLLLLSNSKLTASVDTSDQSELDSNILSGLRRFCDEKDWYPSFMGLTTLASFFSDNGVTDDNITDGLLLVAFVSAVFRRLPVVFEISPNKAARKYAGVNVIRAGLDTFYKQLNEKYHTDLTPTDLLRWSDGLLFTTGSGHIEAKEIIEFKEVYALGQELMTTYGNVSGLRATVIGGNSSNRSGNQSQCIYYTDFSGKRPEYRSTYKHAAVFCFLPWATASIFLNHPFERVGKKALKIKWNHRDEYSEGRYFLVETINGKLPIDFLAGVWDHTKAELEQMQRDHTALPASPKTYSHTIGSAKSRYDTNIWPNAPIWFERVDDKILLRLVRAEPDDSPCFLMEMPPNAIEKNTEELVQLFQRYVDRPSTILSFICESRKYLLSTQASNIEAELMISLLPSTSSKIGIYVNGEYSLGTTRSIGYHNFSQSALVIPTKQTKTTLGFEVFDELEHRAAVKVFVCHASRDKATVHDIMNHMSEGFRQLVVWLDETQLKVGDNLEERIKQEITKNTHYFVAFISTVALKSSWVKDEVNWAIQREISTGEEFMLPVLLDPVWDDLVSSWGPENAEYFKKKRHLMIDDFEAESLEVKARKLSNDLKARIKERTRG